MTSPRTSWVFAQGSAPPRDIFAGIATASGNTSSSVGCTTTSRFRNGSCRCNPRGRRGRDASEGETRGGGHGGVGRVLLACAISGSDGDGRGAPPPAPASPPMRAILSSTRSDERARAQLTSPFAPMPHAAEEPSPASAIRPSDRTETCTAAAARRELKVVAQLVARWTRRGRRSLFLPWNGAAASKQAAALRRSRQRGFRPNLGESRPLDGLPGWRIHPKRRPFSWGFAGVAGLGTASACREGEGIRGEGDGQKAKEIGFFPISRPESRRRTPFHLKSSASGAKGSWPSLVAGGRPTVPRRPLAAADAPPRWRRPRRPRRRKTRRRRRRTRDRTGDVRTRLRSNPAPSVDDSPRRRRSSGSAGAWAKGPVATAKGEFSASSPPRRRPRPPRDRPCRRHRGIRTRRRTKNKAPGGRTSPVTRTTTPTSTRTRRRRRRRAPRRKCSCARRMISPVWVDRRRTAEAPRRSKSRIGSAGAIGGGAGESRREVTSRPARWGSDVRTSGLIALHRLRLAATQDIAVDGRSRDGGCEDAWTRTRRARGTNEEMCNPMFRKGTARRARANRSPRSGGGRVRVCDNPSCLENAERPA